MKLTEQEATHFFDLMWPLQLFVNQSLGINLDITSIPALRELDEKRRLPIRNGIWEHPELIDKFLAANAQTLSVEDASIVAGWKNFVQGTFYIERMLKKHAIFIKDENVYAVLGLFDSFDDFFYAQQLPIAVQAVLLPFQGRIVYDGMLLSYSIFFGGGISGGLKETYMAAKQNDRIITSLGQGKYLPALPVVENLPDYAPQLQEIAALLKKLRATSDAPPVWSPAFTLLRASLDLVEQAVTAPNDIDKLWPKLGKIETASKRMGTILRRSEQ